MLVFPARTFLVQHGALSVNEKLKGRGDVVLVVNYDFRHIVRVEAVRLVKQHGAVPVPEGGLRPAEDHSAVAKEVAEAVFAAKGVIHALEDVGGAVGAHDVKAALELDLLAAVIVQHQNVVGEQKAVALHAVFYFPAVQLQPFHAQFPVASRHHPFPHGVRYLVVQGPAFGVESDFYLAAVGQGHAAFIDDIVGGRKIDGVSYEPPVGLHGVKAHVYLVVNDVEAFGEGLRQGRFVHQFGIYGADVDGIDRIVVN